MFKISKRIFNAVFKFLTDQTVDQYFVVNPSPKIKNDPKEIPQRLRAADVPDFGADQEKMLRLATEKFDDDTMRLKWLRSIHKLNDSRNGWVLDAQVIKNPTTAIYGNNSGLVIPKRVLKSDHSLKLVKPELLVLKR
jgi:hypothetical protein